MTRPPAWHRCLLFALVVLYAQTAFAQSFATGVSYATPVHPNSIAAADFNSDGLIDLAIPSYSPNTLAIFLGAEGGGFSQPATYIAGAGPRFAAVADANGDGHLDVFVVNQDSDDVTPFFGDGTGAFSKQARIFVGTVPFHILPAYINNDAHIDFAVSNSGSDSVSLLLGNGLGSFSVVTLVAGSSPHAVAAADFNGDGHTDLAVAHFGSASVGIFLGNGSGAFELPHDVSVGTNPFTLAASDLNADGQIDLAVPNFGSGTVSILLGNGIGGFAAATAILVGKSPRAVIVTDVDADGISDLDVVNRDSNTVSVLKGVGNGAFTTIGTFGVGSGPFGLVAADLNLDGVLDLAVANRDGHTFSVLRGLLDGTLEAPRAYDTGANPRGVAAADLNNDGKLDLVVANNSANTVSILPGLEDGLFGPGIQLAVRQSPYSPIIADLNGDGQNDIAVPAASANRVSVLLGVGNGGFSPAVNYTAGSGPRALATGDLNRDGRLDLVTANYGGNNVALLLGMASGFAAPLTFGAGTGPTDVEIGDLNQDGLLDLVVSNGGSNSVSVLLGSAVGHFLPSVATSAGTAPSGVGIADFDSDGDLDVVVANEKSNNLTLLRNNGSGGLFGATTLPASTRPLGIVAAEVTGDAFTDVVVANAESESITILESRGDGTFDPIATFPGGVFARALAVADFDGDLQADVAVANSNGNDVWVMLNRSGNIADVAVTLSDGVESVNRGDHVLYTAQVTNAGPSVITAVNLLVTASSQLSDVSLNPSTGSLAATGEWTGLSLSAGASATVTIAGVVVSASGTLTLSVVAATLAGADPVPGNNQAIDHNQVIIGSTDLGVNVTNGTAVVKAGDPVIYSIVVTNAGPTAVSGARIQVPVPVELLSVSWSCVASGGASCSSSGVADIDDTVMLPVAGILSYQLHATIDPFVPAGLLVVTGTVTSHADVLDTDSANNTTTDADTLEGNHPPVPSAQSVSTAEDQSFEISLSATDADGDSLTFSIQTPPSHGTLSGSAPSMTYVPMSNYHGSDNFVFLVSDGIASATSTVSITVTSVQDSPVALNAAYVSAEDAALPINLGAGDADGDPLTYTDLTPPAHGGLVGAGGSRSYQPAPNYFGSDSVTFQVSDGTTSSNVGTITLTITPVNDAPTVAQPIADVTLDGTVPTFVVDLASTFIDLESGVNLTLSAVSSDASLVTVQQNGATLTLEVAPNRAGSATIAVTATDPNGASAQDSFVVNVTPPGVHVSVNDASRGEGSSSGLVFTISLSAPSSSPIVVGFSTGDATASAPGDYAGATGSVTFAPGVIARTVTIYTVGDTVDEDNETLHVTLTSVSAGGTIGDGVGVGTIVDNDTATLSVQDVSTVEGNAGTQLLTFYVSLSVPSSRDVSVNYATALVSGSAAAGVDFVQASGAIFFPAGSTAPQAVPVTIIGDTSDETNEVFSLVLSGATNAGISRGTARGTITDNDEPPTLTVSDVNLSEGQSGTSTFTFTFSLSSPSAFTTRVHYQTADGTATAGSDYTSRSGDVIFSAGITQMTVSIAVAGDLTLEPSETFFLNLSAPVNLVIADSQAQGTILSDETTQ